LMREIVQPSIHHGNQAAESLIVAASPLLE
jgi:hypothetical protein